MTTIVHSLLAVSVLLVSGCSLQEVRSKQRVGVEYRYSGGSESNLQRWTVQQGLEFKWQDGVSTGLVYRRRDNDDGESDHDDGVWFDVSYPIWRAERKPPPSDKDQIAQLRRELAAIRQQMKDLRTIPESPVAALSSTN